MKTFTHIAVDVVRTKRGKTDVVFVATADGHILKLMTTPDGSNACLVESLAPFADSRQSISRMALYRSESDSSSALYLTTERSVSRLSVQRCARFASKQACLGMRDPYCGWDERRGMCAPSPNGNPSSSSWKQDQLSCPDLNAKVSIL